MAYEDEQLSAIWMKTKAVRWVRGKPEVFSVVDAMEDQDAKRRLLVPSVKCYQN